jgi:hypothetical protein
MASGRRVRSTVMHAIVADRAESDTIPARFGAGRG